MIVHAGAATARASPHRRQASIYSSFGPRVLHREHDEEVFDFMGKLYDYFGRQVKVSVDEGGDLSNRFFTASLNAFLKYKPATVGNEPMMYYDPSYLPHAMRWLDALQADYFQNGAPKVFGDFNGEGEIPVTRGCLILAREYIKESTLIPYIQKGMHWRNYLAWELFRNGVKASGIGNTETAILRPATPERVKSR